MSVFFITSTHSAFLSKYYNLIKVTNSIDSLIPLEESFKLLPTNFHSCIPKIAGVSLNNQQTTNRKSFTCRYN